MFNDKRFVDKVSVDKRGRPKNFATKENFEKFYELESSSDSDAEEKEEEETKKSKEIATKKTEVKTVKQKKGKQIEKEKNKPTKKEIIPSPKETKKGQKALKKTETKTKKKKAEESESEDESDVDEKIRSKLRSDGIDYARGEGDLLSDSRYRYYSCHFLNFTSTVFDKIMVLK